jgi:serine/threonine protein kinase
VERLVAVKIVREQWSASSEVVNRTRDEARLLGRLRHKNILRVEELTEIDGHPAIIMEYVDGLDLKQIVETLATRSNQQKGMPGNRPQPSRVSPKTALQVIAHTAAALDAAFNRTPYGMDKPLQVVHRDVKPSNIMISVEGEVKVLDFGTARSSHAFRAAHTGALRMGSLKYMSPERREGDRGEPPGDIYSLGLTAVELLQGAWLPMLPLEAKEHDAAVIEAINALPDVGMPNQDWDVALRRFLVRMLASSPEFRPSAEEVVKTMRAFAEQAKSSSLEAFSSEILLPMTRQLRGGASAGTLAGTRLVVTFGGDTGPKGTKTWDEQAKDSKKAPEAARPTLSNADEPARPSLSKAGTEPISRDTRPSRTAEGRLPAPPPPPDTPLRPVQGTDTFSTPIQPPLPEPRKSIPPKQEVSSQEARQETRQEPPKEQGSGSRMWIAALGGGAILAIGGGLLIVVLLGIGIFLWWTPAPVVVEATPTHASVPSPTPTVVASSGVPVKVFVRGAEPQWLKLDTQTGENLGKQNGNAAGLATSFSVPPGNVVLSIKLVGRSTLSGTAEIPKDGLILDCEFNKDNASMVCTGGKKKLTLK